MSWFFVSLLVACLLGWDILVYLLRREVDALMYNEMVYAMNSFCLLGTPCPHVQECRCVGTNKDSIDRCHSLKMAARYRQRRRQHPRYFYFPCLSNPLLSRDGAR